MSSGPIELIDLSGVSRFKGRSIPAPGGGSMPLEFEMFDFTPTTPGLNVEQFAITAIDTVTPSVTIAGDHTALFPAGVACAIAGSAGNDADGIPIVGSSVVAGDTVVVLASGYAAVDTVTGFLVATGRSGIQVATLAIGDVILPALSTVFIVTAFDGTNPELVLTLGEDPARATYYLASPLSLLAADPSTPLNTVPPDTVQYEANPASSLLGSQPLRAFAPCSFYVYLYSGDGGDPVSSVGECALSIAIQRAP
jgi:hypothetical protein